MHLHSEDELNIELDLKVIGRIIWIRISGLTAYTLKMDIKSLERNIFLYKLLKLEISLLNGLSIQQCIQEGILTTKYAFVNVVENGVYKGIYAFEEGFSEELLASQEKREGVILKLDEDIFWSKQASLSRQNGLCSSTK